MKNKGFTLIELLAVIVILAVIAVIATPIVLNVIDTAKRGALQDSAYSYMSAIEYYVAQTYNDDNVADYDLNGTVKNVSLATVKGTAPTGVNLKLENGKVKSGSISFNDYAIIIVDGKVNDITQTKVTITLLGNEVVNHPVGSEYTDAGATAYDLIDEDITSSITTEGTVNSNTLGTYTITYNVINSQGIAASKIRTVNVTDQTKPLITISGNNPFTHPAGSVYTDAGATASDNLDGSITAKIQTTSNVVPGVVGTYQVTYSVTDANGNTQTATRTVNVIDTTNPTVSFGTNGNNAYAKTYSTTVSVSDNAELNTSSFKYQWTNSTTAPTEASFSQTFTSGGTISSPAGLSGGYYLWILAKDSATNTTITRSNVFNLDNTLPVITANSNTSNFTISVGRKSGTYTPPTGTATDNSGVNPSVVITSNTVNLGTNGTYSVVYSATDAAGNNKTLTMTVNIVDPTYTSWMTSTDFTAAGYSTSSPLTTTKTQYNITYSNTTTTPQSGTVMAASQNNGCCWANSLAVGSGGPYYVTQFYYWHQTCNWDDFGYNGMVAWVELYNYDTGVWERLYSRTFLSEASYDNAFDGYVGVSGTKRYSQIRIHTDGKHCQNVNVRVTAWNVYNTTTGTTGWQDSSTTGLGTYVSHVTRTVYRYQTN